MRRSTMRSIAGINFMDTAEVYAVPSSAGDLRQDREHHRHTGSRRPASATSGILATKVPAAARWIRNGRRIDGTPIREAVEGSLQAPADRLYRSLPDPWAARGHYHFGQLDLCPPQPGHAEDVRHHEETPDGARRDGQGGQDPPCRPLQRDAPGASGSGSGLPSERPAAGRLGAERIQPDPPLFDLDLAELGHHEDVGLLAYSPLASGVLTGKYLDGKMPAGTRGCIQPGGLWRNNEHLRAGDPRLYRACRASTGSTWRRWPSPSA